MAEILTFPAIADRPPDEGILSDDAWAKLIELMRTAERWEVELYIIEMVSGEG